MNEGKTDDTVSASSRESKSGRRSDYCNELLRSIGLFVSTIRLIAMTAVMMVVETNHSYVKAILQATDNELEQLESIPDSVHLITIINFMQAVVCIFLAIVGYARLMRTVILYFGHSCVLTITWYVIFAIILQTRDQIDPNRRKWFIEANNDFDAGIKASIVQKTFNCCGSVDQTYETASKLPPSCCPSAEGTKECTKENKFTKLCSFEKFTLSKDGHKYGFTDSFNMFMLRMLLGVIEGGVAYSLAFRLWQQNRDEFVT